MSCQGPAPVRSQDSFGREKAGNGGTGNTLFAPDHPYECFFPKQFSGGVRCFGLPDDGAAGE